LSYDTPVSGGYLMGAEQIPGLPGDIAAPAAAYSVRKVKSDYTGFCMDVRRDSDDTTGSIGFDAFGNLDTGSLLAFVTGSEGTGSGFVARWYDQSGNDNHATQSVAASQPLILSSGSITTSGGIPSPLWPSFNQFLSLPRLTTVQSVFHVSQLTNSSGGNTYILGDISTNDYHSGTGIWLNNNAASYVRNGANYINGVAENFLTKNKDTNRNILTLIHTSPNGQVSQITKDRNFSRGWLGYIQELILYTSDQTGNRQGVEYNINSYFNIYTQPVYNVNSNSLSLFSSPTVVAGAANAAPTQLITGGPEGLITVSRTGSSDYTLWKNRVPTKTTLPASTPLSNEIYLNSANLSNALFSGSQNSVSYASVGAGLTDDEVYTYYELVDDLQTSLNRGVVDPNAFITVWDTTKTGTGTVTGTSSIALPLFGTQAITASWGDGTVSLISQSLQNDRIHTYATPGIYTVSITGTGQGFNFNGGGDRLKLMDIGQWGSISGSTSGVFFGCSNLKGTAADPHVLQTTNLAQYFRDNNSSIFNGYIGNWNVSNVTDISNMFFLATTFNQNIGAWNVSNVTNMSGMFQRAYSFNQPIGTWNTSKVTNMSGMIAYGGAFNQDIGSWDVSSVTNFNDMFLDHTGFQNGGSPSINNWQIKTTSNVTMNRMFGSLGLNQFATRFNQPIGNWNTSAVTDMANMFSSNIYFNQNLSNWNVEKVTTFSNIFINAAAFNNSGSSDINNWRPISCSNFSSMFQNATSFNQPIGNWTIGTGSNMNVTMANMFNNADAFNQNIGAWNVEKVTNMSGMFSANGGFNNSGSSDINNWRPISCSNFVSMFQSATAFNQPIGNWPISASNINMNFMFFSNTIFNQNIGSWDMSKVINPESMFRGATAFNNSGSSDIDNWNTSNFTITADMFSGATAFNQPIGNWNVNKVTDMRFMFNSAGAFNQDLSTWDLSGVTSTNGVRFMFINATAFNNGGSPGINNWNTSNIKTMEGMFQNATAFNQDIGNWNVSSCTNFNGFMANKTTYSYLHTIYDGWIQNRLQPQRTINFNTINYSASAAEGKALLERPYVTQSVVNIQDSSSFINIVTQDAHSLTPGNKVFIYNVSGSISGSVNGLRTVLSTGSATEFTLSGSVFNPADIYDMGTGLVITGYGWNITDGDPV
jgi:surface protein